MDEESCLAADLDTVSLLSLLVKDIVSSSSKVNLRDGIGSVAHAIANTTGVWIKDLPITPEKILRALKEKK